MGGIESISRTPLSQVVLFAAGCTLLRLLIHPVVLRQGHRGLLGLLDTLTDACIYASLSIFFLIRPFVIQPFTVPTGSMLQTIAVDDFLFADKWTYRTRPPKTGEIVIFEPPGYAQQGAHSDVFVKRCVGVPGDVVEIRAGLLYRNGRLVSEPYLFTAPDWDFKLVRYKGRIWPVNTKQGYANDPNITPVASPFVAKSNAEMDALVKLPAVPLPKGQYLMMGDNRATSFDGRAWGPVPRSAVVGRAMAIWLPLNRMRGL